MTIIRRIKAVLTMMLFCELIFTHALAQQAIDLPTIPNGTVSDITRGGGKTFMVGGFDWWGTQLANTGSVVLDSNLGIVSGYASLPGVNYSVSDEAGGWYVAGYNSVGHILADKTYVEILNDAQGIYAISKAGNLLYVGGPFLSIQGQARKYLAAIDLTTKTVTSWNPSPDGYVYSINAQASVVYVGGSFSSIGGQSREKLGAISPTTGLATSWNPKIATGFGYVIDIAVTASTVYFGGSFTNVNGSAPSRRNLASVSASTAALVTTFNPRPTDPVNHLLLDGNTLYVAGDFTQIAGKASIALAAIDATNGSLLAFNASLPDVTYGNEVYDLELDGQKLFVAGDFSTIGGNPQKARLAALDKTTGALFPTEDRNLSDAPSTLSMSGGNLFVGGDIQGITGVSRPGGFVALDDKTQQPTAWYPGNYYTYSGEIYVYNLRIQYANDRIYYLITYSNNTAELGAFNTTDGAKIPGLHLDIDGVVEDWTFSKDAVYLAGNFTQVNKTPRNGAAAFKLEDLSLLPWTIAHSPVYNAGENVSGLLYYENTIYISGSFHYTTGGVERTGLIAWDATTGAIKSWAPQLDFSDYNEIIVGGGNNGKIYLKGGECYRVDAVSGEADDWRFTPDQQGQFIDIAFQGNTVVVAGSFSPGLVRLNTTDGSPVSVQPEINDVYDGEQEVETLAVSGNTLYVGGSFDYTSNGHDRRGFAEFLYEESGNLPPAIQAVAIGVSPGKIITIDLRPLLSDPDGNLDITSLKILELPASGATATIDVNYRLVLDYTNIDFSGSEGVTIEVCDLLNACTEQYLSIEAGGELIVYNGISPNADDKNESLFIANIDLYPASNNKVVIYNRWGDAVFEKKNYDNVTDAWRGQGKNGNDLPPGTYFYKIVFDDGSATKTGYIALKR